tara:strand:- start:2193 stop:2657 length:465 start_codon:yes stop_codon:yes gene_type:complete
MPPTSVYKYGKYGMATLSGSSNDATVYKNIKHAKSFYAALLDPAAESIRRKSGVSYKKHQHGLIYRYDYKQIALSDVTKEMHVLSRVTKNTEPDTIVRAGYPVLDAKRTFQLQTTLPGELVTSPPPAVNTIQKRKGFNIANIEGIRTHNRQRDW